MNTLSAAKLYVSKGLSVIPLYHPDFDPAAEGKKGKRPKIAWREYQTRKPTEQELEAWFGGEPTNIGIVTGKISGLDVIDFDTVEAFEMAQKLGIDDSVRVKTGKGYHVFCKATGKGNFQKRDDLKGIDYRGEGGYVVAPPSKHESGVEYIWEKRGKLSNPPAWLFKTDKNQEVKKPIAELYSGTESGNRNQTLARLCGVWAIHLSPQEVLESAITWNKGNNPPLDLEEIRITVNSICNKERNKTAIEEGEIVYIELLKDKLYKVYEEGLRRGESTGWKTLDEYYTVREGEWTVVNGIPGSGKTEFLDNLMVNLSLRGWKFGVFSAENLPHERHLISLVEKYLGMPFTKGRNLRASSEQVEVALNYLKERFFFIAPDEKRMTLNRILEIAEEIHRKHNIKGLLIDPWNELDHSRANNFSETEFISECLTKARRFAREKKLHLWIVAHPTKLQKDKEGNYPVPTPYDISGSAHWRNKADNALSIWRDITNPSEPTQINIQKIRFREVGKIGKVGLRYDVITGRYNECEEIKDGGFFGEYK